MTARELAELGQIPTNYLSKIMRQLVRADLLAGTRGIGGGFRFAKPPQQIRLIEIVDLFEQVDRPRVCPFGNRTCSDENSCALHDRWGAVRANFVRVLAETDLASAAKDPSGRGAGRARKGRPGKGRSSGRRR